MPNPWRPITEADKKAGPLQIILGWSDLDGADHFGEGYWCDGGWCIPGIDLWNSQLPTHCMDFPPLPASAGKRKAVKRGYTPEFETSVWGPYPRKQGTSKLDAFRKFERLSDTEKEMVVLAIPHYTKMVAGRDQDKIHHLENFIGKRISETIS